MSFACPAPRCILPLITVKMLQLMGEGRIRTKGMFLIHSLTQVKEVFQMIGAAPRAFLKNYADGRGSSEVVE